jgi:hypothetical protein
MGLIRKNLDTILGAFTKPLAELDAFVQQERKRVGIFENNIAKLEQMIDNQDGARLEALDNINKAEVYKARLTEFLGSDGPVKLGS